ncbi:methyltransferase TRM13-domain-containing protein [Kickxella alabastrina]|uniref:methyltransferase TRM13-domain-containing protein n=1 Tax=Kickxella alabastrina TaxID=61397 RepID=UPI00221F6200|nr:methyltransferase TRM13-domain-containing protein [Kickxella alabastrina]KAI7834277.1 methyltransferase TRM13-domain-containing protein [Kickxella alabastrina]
MSTSPSAHHQHQHQPKRAKAGTTDKQTAAAIGKAAAPRITAQPPVKGDNRCHFFVVNKGRYCPFMTKNNSKYCGEHMVVSDSKSASIPERVPCPYDPSHSVDLHKLKKHMSSLCNARPPDERPAYTLPDCNITLLPSGYAEGLFSKCGQMWSEEGLAKADARLMVKPGEQIYMGGVSRTFGELASLSENPKAKPGNTLDEQTVSRLLKPVVLSYLRSVGALQLTENNIATEQSLKDLLELVRPSQEFPMEICTHPSVDERKHRKINPKHTLQQSSLIGHLEQHNLLDPKYAFVEFGAGKGELSVYVHAALAKKQAEAELESSSIFLVDRKNFRQKFNIDEPDRAPSGTTDATSDCDKHQSHARRQFQRIYIDIRDLNLASVEGLQITDPSTGKVTLRPIVAYSKHLCGAATDLTIKCIERYQQAGGHVAGVAIALCCHHVCKYSMFVDHTYLSKATTSHSAADLGQWCDTQRDEFRHLATMSSWAINSPAPPASSAPNSELDKAVAAAHYSGLTHSQRVCAGHAVKRFLDIGRAEYMRYQLRMDSVGLVYYTTRIASPENLALLATKLEA